MKTLIYSGVFCQNQENRDTVRLWGRLVNFLNPDTDVVVFNSMSPFDPEYFLPSRFHIHNFEDNPGHLAQGGGDGAGRTFCAGIDYAAQYGYDYAVHLESDFFLSKPIARIIDAMDRVGVNISCCFLPQYQFSELGLCAMNVRRMVETDFVGRYDWENSPKWPIPERRIPDLMGDDLWYLPIYGTRVDQNQFNAHTLANHYPYAPPDWITHCSVDLAMKFLELNSIQLPEEAP